MDSKIGEARTCRTCGLTSSDPDLFEKRKAGRPFCKECRNRYQRQWRKTHTSPRNREVERAAYRRYLARHPLKYRAWLEVTKAVRKGLLIRPELCTNCGNKGKIEAHHDDYTKPLDVCWLCRGCHLTADEQRKAQEAA